MKTNALQHHSKIIYSIIYCIKLVLVLLSLNKTFLFLCTLLLMAGTLLHSLPLQFLQLTTNPLALAELLQLPASVPAGVQLPAPVPTDVQVLVQYPFTCSHLFQHQHLGSHFGFHDLESADDTPNTIMNYLGLLPGHG